LNLGRNLQSQPNGDFLRLEAAKALERLVWNSDARSIYLILANNRRGDPLVAREAFAALRRLP
jgi:hypothetical protein